MMGKWYHVCIPLEFSSSKESMDTTEKWGIDFWESALGMTGVGGEMECMSGEIWVG